MNCEWRVVKGKKREIQNTGMTGEGGKTRRKEGIDRGGRGTEKRRGEGRGIGREGLTWGGQGSRMKGH